MSTSSSSQVVHGGAKLEELCLAEGKKAPRPDPEKEAPYNETAIYQYSLRHGGGIAYLYVNETSDLLLEEEIEFQLVGLEIEDAPGESKVEVKVGPGEKKLLKIRSTEGQWKISSAVAYGIYDANEERE